MQIRDITNFKSGL